MLTHHRADVVRAQVPGLAEAVTWQVVGAVAPARAADQVLREVLRVLIRAVARAPMLGQRGVTPAPREAATPISRSHHMHDKYFSNDIDTASHSSRWSCCDFRFLSDLELWTGILGKKTGL